MAVWLKRRRLVPPALWVAVALALCGHFLVLRWVAPAFLTPSVLRPMVPPLWTRRILPTPPPVRTPAKRSTPATPAPPSQKVPRRPPVSLRPAPVQDSLALATQAVAPLTPASAVPDVSDTDTSTAATPTTSSPEATVTAQVADSSSTTSTPSNASTTIAKWPPNTRLSYKVSGYYRGELHGDASVMWQHQTSGGLDNYQVAFEVKLWPLVQLTVTSQGRVDDNGLYPTAYEEQTKQLMKSDRRRSVVLKDGELILEDGRHVPRPDGVQDTASQFVDLTHRFQWDTTLLQPGNTVTVNLARPAGVDPWVYDVVGQDILNTSLGAIPAWHLVPRPLDRPRGNITAELWFAPTLDYLPVRVILNVGAESKLDLMLDKVEQ